ncbi:MAG: radical SAM protein [Anaerolineales bacterium]|nr:radical SAM protein [Anaerolineales bacterium]
MSAGVLGGGSHSQDKLLDTADILRNKLGYQGYFHLKVMPGVERDQVQRAMELADRVSVNLEAPNPDRLYRIAPQKKFREELWHPLQWIEEIRRSQPAERGWHRRWPSSSTQFVVGAAQESDLEILSTVAHLTHEMNLSRAYFEAFNPVPGTPLENAPAENPKRQHRLYQASFLLRDYGFDLEDMPFTCEGNLPLEPDPKLAYAQAALVHSPVEVNKADRNDLLRVPGIGPKTATAILRARGQNKIRAIRDLRKIGVIAERAAPYITLDGRRPPQQLKLL